MGVLLVEQTEEGAAAVRQRIAAQVQTRRDTLGSIVDMSTHSRPPLTPSSTPPRPR